METSVEFEEFYKIESTHRSACITKAGRDTYTKEEAEAIFYDMLTEEQQEEFVIVKQAQ